MKPSKCQKITFIHRLRVKGTQNSKNKVQGSPQSSKIYLDCSSQLKLFRARRRLRADKPSLLLSALRPCLWRIFGEKNEKRNSLVRKFSTNNVSFRSLAILMFVSLVTGFSVLQTSYASAASLTLTVPGAIKLEINPGASATFSKSSASSIGVKTDAAFGYDLSIKVKDGANGNSLVNGSNKLSSISANLSEESYKAAGNDNTWGYLPSKVNSSDNTEFLPGPTTSLTTIDKSSAKNDTDNNYSVTLAAKVDQTIPTGNYTNIFVFTAAANTVSYSITYDLNSGSGGPSPNPQTGTTSNGTIKLDSTAPTREGYEFKGWCTVSTSDENCSGTTYQPGADFPLQNDSNSLTLYAMWKSTDRSYTINYHSNLPGANGIPNKQTGIATASNGYKVNISSSSPTLSGYDFKDWCSNSTNSASCSGTSYSAGASWTVPLDGSTLDLYAKWEKASNCPNAVTDCSASGYPGKRFGNGRCWMSTDYQSSVYWSEYLSCPSGWSVPTKSDFENLISSSQAGNGSCLHEQGWSEYTWSSTWSETGVPFPYCLGVFESNAVVHQSNMTTQNVRCVAQ